MRRSTPISVVAAAAVLLLAGCTATAPTPTATPAAASSPAATTPTPGAAGPTPSPTPTAASRTPPSPSASTTPTSDAAGCSSGTSTIPAGAATTRITDVDGDGLRDILFLGERVLGIRTAHGTFTIPDLLPRSGRPHTAWYTATDGSPGRTIVVDDGAHATVQAFRDCRLVRILDERGQPLQLPVGGSATSATGVACNDQNGGVLIEASRAVQRADGRYDVTWRNLGFVDAQDRAHFDAPEARWTSLAASDSRVAQARTSHCWAAIGTVTAPGS